MSMSPENYRNLETRCNSLCQRCLDIINSFDIDAPYVEVNIEETYREIVAMATELSIAIRNVKTQEKKLKYENLLKM